LSRREEKYQLSESRKVVVTWSCRFVADLTQQFINAPQWHGQRNKCTQSKTSVVDMTWPYVGLRIEQTGL